MQIQTITMWQASISSLNLIDAVSQRIKSIFNNVSSSFSKQGDGSLAYFWQWNSYRCSSWYFPPGFGTILTIPYSENPYGNPPPIRLTADWRGNFINSIECLIWFVFILGMQKSFCWPFPALSVQYISGLILMIYNIIKAIGMKLAREPSPCPSDLQLIERAIS